MNLESQTPGPRVAQYMTTNPITVRSDITFTDAVARMTSNRIGNLIVVENEKPIGILTEREILQYLSLSSQCLLSGTSVQCTANRPIICI